MSINRWLDVIEILIDVASTEDGQHRIEIWHLDDMKFILDDVEKIKAFLKAAGEIKDKRDALKVIDVASKSPWDDEYLEAINALRDLIEALPEVKP
jgi:hypothetical protein